MYKLRQIKAEDMFHVVRELTKYGRSARITVTGMSMYPFLREGIDSVELSHADFAGITIGSIVLILRKSGQYVLHRVVRKKNDCFYITGDAQRQIEGPLLPEQLMAVVTAVWRRGRRILCTDAAWKAFSAMWIVMLPFRGIILRMLGIICKGAAACCRRTRPPYTRRISS